MFLLGQNDYITEAEKQLGDETAYMNINFKDKILQELADTSVIVDLLVIS